MIKIFSIVEKDNYMLMGQWSEDRRLFLHFNWTGGSWSKRKYVDLLEDWSTILETFQAMGISEVWSAIPHEWDGARKWQTLFGLSPVEETEQALHYKLEI